MSSVLESSELLQLCPISNDIQNIILYMLLGYGTAAAASIRSLITELNAPNNIYKTNLLFRFYPSLWRYLVIKNGSRIASYFKHPEIYNNLECIYELKRAFLQRFSNRYVSIKYLVLQMQELVKKRLKTVIDEEKGLIVSLHF